MDIGENEIAKNKWDTVNDRLNALGQLNAHVE